MRLAGVLDHHQPIALRQLEDRIHIGHLPVQMDRNDGRDRPSAAAADQPARIVDGALFLQILLEFCRIHVVGLLIDVHELGQCAGLRNRFRGGDEGVRHGDHNVAGLHSAGHEGEAQSVGAAADRDRIAGVAEGGECFLKFFHHRAADESGGPQGLAENFGQLLLEFHVRSNQIKKRNAVAAVL